MMHSSGASHSKHPSQSRNSTATSGSGGEPPRHAVSHDSTPYTFSGTGSVKVPVPRDTYVCKCCTTRHDLIHARALPGSPRASQRPPAS